MERRKSARFRYLRGSGWLRRASAPAPAHWEVAEPWRESAPKDAIGKGEWWTVFNDDGLTALEKDALASNQTIKISVARLEQARALSAVQISTQFPQFAVASAIERLGTKDFADLTAFSAVSKGVAV